PDLATDCQPLSLRDALPISQRQIDRLFERRYLEVRQPGEPGAAELMAKDDHVRLGSMQPRQRDARVGRVKERSLAFHDVPVILGDRKSTRLNSSHVKISYAV